MGDDLTRDNLLLSRPTNAPLTIAPARAVDCISNLPERVAGYVADSLADNTRELSRNLGDDV